MSRSLGLQRTRQERDQIANNAMLLRLIIRTQQLTAITWRSLRFKASGHFPKTPDSNPNPSDANLGGLCPPNPPVGNETVINTYIHTVLD